MLVGFEVVWLLLLDCCIYEWDVLSLELKILWGLDFGDEFVDVSGCENDLFSLCWFMFLLLDFDDSKFWWLL